MVVAHARLLGLPAAAADQELLLAAGDWEQASRAAGMARPSIVNPWSTLPACGRAELPLLRS